MRLALLVWLLSCLTLAAPLQVKVSGTARTAEGWAAIVAGPSMTFLVKTGDDLGDYHIDAIDHHSVTFRYGEQRFPIELQNAAGRSLNPTPKQCQPRDQDDALSLYLSDADPVYVLKLLARMQKQNICIESGAVLEGGVQVQLQRGSLSGAMQVVAESAGLRLAERHGVVVAAGAGALARQPRLTGEKHAAKPPVTLDFVNADLVYVLMILAKETRHSVIVGPLVEGTVTVTLKSLPCSQVLKLVLGIQPEPLSASLDGKLMVVGRQVPPVRPIKTPGPLITYAPQFEKAEVPVAELVSRVAALLHLRPVMPPEFKGTVWVQLEHTPALPALERALSLHHHHFTIAKGQLRVEPD